MVFREFLFFFALALTTYDALQNSPPKISDVPRPVPFFDKGSLVSDWYKGDLSKALPVIFSYDVSFVMYYAPWDAESQHVKRDFDKAAQIMLKHVHFAAINCWQPGSECRMHHIHISVWPIIIVHTNLWKTLIYNGPKDYTSMVKFLHQVIKPMTRLNSNDSLYELLSVCDAVVVGFIPMENDTVAYNIFYNVALKKLEIDPFRDICFGIVTSEKLALDMGVTRLPHIRLMLWNDTLEYPIKMIFNEENISNWLMSTYIHPGWVLPSWHKSTKMQGLFNYGPVLVMFTPRNLFHDRTPSYDLLKETALEYNNCKQDPIIRMITRMRKLQRRKYADYERNKSAVCKDFSQTSDNIVMKLTPRKFQKPDNTKNMWFNKTSCKKDILNRRLDYFSISDDSYLQFGTYASGENSLKVDGYCVKNNKEACLQDFHKSTSMLNNFNILDSVSDKEELIEPNYIIETSMLDVFADPKSAVNLMKNYIKDICANVELARNVEPQAIPIISDSDYNIEGLKCQTNHSLSFIAIDSILNPQFAESLGIDITKKTDKTAVVILDNKHESQYLLDKPLGEHSIREFIYNFTMDYLPRNLRTPVENSDYMHFYGSDKTFKNNQSTKNNASGEIGHISRWCKFLGKNRKYICIKELNTSTFNDFVTQKNKALLVVFCSKGSGSCGGLLTLSLLRVVRSLWEIKGYFEIAQIDASVNDLPWEYTVSKYPTLMFFPSEKKEDSRSYPDDKAVTVEGILAFILTGLDTPTRLHAQVLLCNNTLDDLSMKKCLSSIRRSVVGLIGKMLRHWRQSQNFIVKNLLLRRLQCLRTVAINLGALNTTKVPLADPVYKSFNDSILALMKIWRVALIPPSFNYNNL